MGKLTFKQIIEVFHNDVYCIHHYKIYINKVCLIFVAKLLYYDFCFKFKPNHLNLDI